MDALSLLRTLGALVLLLGLLGGALWAVRRYDIRLPGRVTTGARRRVELVERLAIDAKRSVALIRRDGCEHLILLAPDGHVMIETGITSAPRAPAANDARDPREDLATVRASFSALVERASARVRARG